MTNVADLITYLQTLPPETRVRVAVAVEGNYSAYTAWEDLELPEGISPDCSDNLDFMGSGEPWLCLGRS